MFCTLFLDYVYLIPVYFILTLQSLLGLFMLAMKQFNSRKSILITMIPASLLMLIGILIMLYFQSLNELWGLLSIYLIFGLFIFVLPSSQYLILNKLLVCCPFYNSLLYIVKIYLLYFYLYTW